MQHMACGLGYGLKDYCVHTIEQLASAIKQFMFVLWAAVSRIADCFSLCHTMSQHPLTVSGLSLLN
jgi:hypothetical protein